MTFPARRFSHGAQRNDGERARWTVKQKALREESSGSLIPTPFCLPSADFVTEIIKMQYGDDAARDGLNI